MDEEVPVTLAGEQPCEPYQHRPVRRLQYRPMNLAAEQRDFVSEHDDLHVEINVAPADGSDQLADAAERSVEEREGHCRMLAVVGLMP